MTYPLAGQIANPGQVRDLITGLERRGARDCSYATAGDLASSTGAEVAMTAWDTDRDNAFTFRTGHIYALQCQCAVYNAGATSSVIERSLVRVRKAVNSTSAQSLSEHLVTTFGGTSTNGAYVAHWTSYVANGTGADISDVHLGLTVSRANGTNTNRIYGDATYPAMVVLVDLGLIADNTNLAAIAIDIT